MCHIFVVLPAKGPPTIIPTPKPSITNEDNSDGLASRNNSTAAAYGMPSNTAISTPNTGR